MKRFCISILIVSFCAMIILAGCSADVERDAKRQAIDFAEQVAGFNIHNHDHDLEVKESAVGENHYYVEGTIKKESDLTHHSLFATLEVDEDENMWYLKELFLDDEELYYVE